MILGLTCLFLATAQIAISLLMALVSWLAELRESLVQQMSMGNIFKGVLLYCFGFVIGL